MAAGGLLFHGLSLWLRLDVDGYPHDQTGTLYCGSQSPSQKECLVP